MTISEQQIQTDLLGAGIIRAVALMSLVAMVAICHIYAEQIQFAYELQDRVVLRTILYVAAIFSFPLMKFVRHVLVRLNQTSKTDKSAKSRYLFTISISMLVCASIGLYGLLMYVLGDSFNTLYIFVGLSALAMFLYRPNKDEYLSIVQALEDLSNS
ncbi:MAG: hypothetical protein RQ733_11060 [Methyloprofundus sp.]|nr:hypothetical protein [Methyloprofundus sp.]MDT8426500.1 hypothetical protein [Methyloprofundus sp.]